jgi:TatD DNase family protein
MPMRGRRNEPAFLPHILAKLAEIRGWSLDEAERRTEAAFFDLFHTIPRPVRPESGA